MNAYLEKLCVFMHDDNSDVTTQLAEYFQADKDCTFHIPSTSGLCGVHGL